MSVKLLPEEVITLDFETLAIEPRPSYPPNPVGLAVRYPDGESDYFSWGHPKDNNTTFKEVKSWLIDLWRSETPLLFYNAKFDLAVAYEKFNLPKLSWDRVHDAMFLVFLADPHSKSNALKEAAEDILDWLPEEKDAVAEYVWENRRGLEEEYGGRVTKTNSGAWIGRCPARIVEPYAIGDVDRTYSLFEHLFPLIVDNHMLEGYDRERRVMPVFMEIEEKGIQLDFEGLCKDIPKFKKSIGKADTIIRDMLGYDDLNLDADAKVAEAFTECGVILEEDWVKTKKSKQKSVSKDNLPFSKFQDEEVAHLWFYRNRMKTFISTFLEPWYELTKNTGGVLYPNFHQTRNPEGGTRTGRPSCSKPNILNIPKRFDAEFDMPEGNEYSLEPLPRPRDYVMADKGEVFIHRDYNQQELRIFAHFEDGELLEAYRRDPNLDLHSIVGKRMADIRGEDYSEKTHRVPAKAMNFGRLYGKGKPAVSKDLNCSLNEAATFIKQHDEALPGIKHMSTAISEIVRAGEPIRTLGGRCYFPETPKIIDGKRRTFEYKLTNYEIQGSAAEMTKEAMVLYHNHPERRGRLLCQVYDEMNASVPLRWLGHEMEVLDACMLQAADNLKVDCPMLTDGKHGERWGRLESYVEG